ncbi:MAG: energy transducer TonB [Proteobacteria bacterium]|nr:energy transducer TonB [Pseudomonadota bacterium]
MFNLKKAFVISIAMHGLAMLVIMYAISPLNLTGNPEGERILLVDLVAKKISSAAKSSSFNSDKIESKKAAFKSKALLLKAQNRLTKKVDEADRIKDVNTEDISPPIDPETMPSVKNASLVNRDRPEKESKMSRAMTGSGSPSTAKTDGPVKQQALGSDFIPLILSKIEAAKIYPKSAIRRGLEGAATIKFRIRTDGQVDEVNLVESSGFDVLDRASIKAIKKAAPFPYVDFWLKVAVNFKLT